MSRNQEKEVHILNFFFFEEFSMHHVYVLQSKKDGKWYIGCTSDIATRLETHNLGRVASTKLRRPFVLIFKEGYQDKYEAFRMERFYKSATGKRQLKQKILTYSEIV